MTPEAAFQEFESLGLFVTTEIDWIFSSMVDLVRFDHAELSRKALRLVYKHTAQDLAASISKVQLLTTSTSDMFANTSKLVHSAKMLAE